MNLNSGNSNKYLLEQIQKGDVKAFDLLFEEYSQRLYGFAFSMLKNHEDAKEIVQESFLKIWQKRSEINSSNSFKSYLFAISYNITIDLLRKRSSEQKYHNYLKDHFNIEVSSTEEQVQYNDLNDALTLLLNELPEKRRNIYKLSREEGLSHKEIAAKLGISIKTVENQINLTLKYLKAKLGTNQLMVVLFISLFA